MRIKRTKNRARGIKAGTAERPRLAVFRSLNHIYAQIINDDESKTLVSADSLKVKDKAKKVDLAVTVGKEIAKQAKAKGITKVLFDRRDKRFHGRIAALANAAREGGLEF
jgi:large subunit ribosomal protein L18